LLQLIYTAMVSGAPHRRRRFDVLAGRLDGLLWRVTLADDGKPTGLRHDPSLWLLSPVHSDRTGARRGRSPRPSTKVCSSHRRCARRANERVVLRLASGTHYLQQVEIARGWRRRRGVPWRCATTTNCARCRCPMAARAALSVPMD
jgi:hypothetical protein